jgi:hypothetical protein
MTEEAVQPSKTFRIFVSSTFSDLKAERDRLQRFVFPRLRELCARHEGRFQAIDLRWGVSEEAGLDQRTMSISRYRCEDSSFVEIAAPCAAHVARARLRALRGLALGERFSTRLWSVPTGRRLP